MAKQRVVYVQSFPLYESYKLQLDEHWTSGLQIQRTPEAFGQQK